MGPRRSAWSVRAGRAPRAPYAVRFSLKEILIGAGLAVLSFMVAWGVAEFGVWVMTLWMIPEETIVNYFYVVFACINAMFVAGPLSRREILRGIVVLAVVCIITYAMISQGFHPVRSLFGELPY